ncbi:MAG: TatD family hydrolase [Patescibacteria group bacterium]|jgi:TatD DNase family protein
MSNLIDTHCHLNFNAYKDDLDQVIERTLAAGMRVINIGSQSTTSQRAVELAKQHPGKFFAAIGLHPLHLFETFVDKDEVDIPFKTRQEVFDVAFYSNLAKEKGVVAVGECGVDYYRVPDGIDPQVFVARQKEVFLQQAAFAQGHDLPLVLHTRAHPKEPTKAYNDLLELLQHAGYNRGVVHCYTGDVDTARKFVDAGCLISFTGIITFPNATKLLDVVRFVPLDRMMVETDAPYLAPQQFRGKRNEPLYVQHVADKIAEVKGIGVEEVVRQTTKNAEVFFHLP